MAGSVRQRAIRWRSPLVACAVVVLVAALGFGAGSVLDGGPRPTAPRVGVDAAPAGSGSDCAGTESDAARNVILFVGDGMGATHRTAARLVRSGLHGQLAMETLPHVGLARTSSADRSEFVTDSAAAGTALATGVKTYNGAIAVDLTRAPVTTLLESAEAAGMSTGLVTTAEVTDATPAAFGAHLNDRDDQTEIARQYIAETGIDVLLGGGEDFWFPPGDPGAFPDSPATDPSEGSRGNQGSLVERATTEFGYQYVSTAEDLRAVQGDRVLGLFSNREMFQQAGEGEGDVYDPVVSLEQMTRKAIETLAGADDGFVLVVEEEAIDEMAHHNNGQRTIDAVLALDDAVAAGIDFAERDCRTLVVVTGDHETGGMTVEETSARGGAVASVEDGPFDIDASSMRLSIDWTTSDHTGADVPVTSMGPGSAALSGTYENTWVHDVMLEAITR